MHGRLRVCYKFTNVRFNDDNMLLLLYNNGPLSSVVMNADMRFSATRIKRRPIITAKINCLPPGIEIKVEF